MRRHLTKLGLVSVIMTMAMLSSTMAFALPLQAQAHAQTASGSNDSSAGASQAAAGQANGEEHLAAAKLRACQNRENAIKNIMTRIDARAQNQLTLFGTIATRVENFYTKKGKTVSNYDQLVAAVNSAKSQAETDLGTLKSNSTFSCSASNPKGVVTAFQGYLKTEISDLQNYRTAVKNLIVAVAKANGVTVSDSSQSSNQSSAQGGQQ